MASRKIVDLVPALQERYKCFAEQVLLANIHFIVTCTKRSAAEQAALYAQGRQPLSEVNTLRHGVNLPPITSEANERCVTWTMQTKHTQGRAFDICILNEKGIAQWDAIKTDVNHNDVPDYLEVAKIGRSCGLICGADFKDRFGHPRPDYAHFELPIDII